MNNNISTIQNKLIIFQKKESRLKNEKINAYWFNERSESHQNTKLIARFIHRKDNIFRRALILLLFEKKSQRKVKKKYYCKFCKKFKHKIDNCNKINEVHRHLSKLKSRSIFKTNFKDSKNRFFKYSFKNKNVSRDKKNTFFIKNARSLKFHNYAVNFDSKKKFEKNESKFKKKTKHMWSS